MKAIIANLTRLTNRWLKVVLCCAVIISCSGLDLEPESSLIKEEFWKSREDIETVLVGTYNSFRSSALKSFILGELRANHVSLGGLDKFSDYTQIKAFNISTSNKTLRWLEYYSTINLANYVMFYIPVVKQLDPTLTDELARGYEAEMLFLRSLCYFYMVRLWKEVPLVLQPTLSDTVNIYLPKSPEHVIINQIITDLTRALPMAFTDKFSQTPELYKGRANKTAIQALLADVYLWSEQYQKVIDICDDIIGNSGLTLEPRETWFNLYYPGNSLRESIFEIQFDDNFEGQENPINIDLLALSIRRTLTITPILFSLYPLDHASDVRKCLANTPTWKYVGINLAAPSILRSADQRSANFIYYRFADILLIQAEAYAELDRFNEANTRLGQIAERAGISHQSVFSRDALRQAVLTERGREFAVEGKRWFDVLRHAKKEGFKNKQLVIDMLITGDVKTDAVLRPRLSDTMSYYLPIFYDELLYNHNLTQNPFYDR